MSEETELRRFNGARITLSSSDEQTCGACGHTMPGPTDGRRALHMAEHTQALVDLIAELRELGDLDKRYAQNPQHDGPDVTYIVPMEIRSHLSWKAKEILDKYDPNQGKEQQ